jgi:hypothetical protein
MSRWQTFRIALLLLAIFAGGFAAGRFTAPVPAPTPTPASASPGFAGPAGRIYTVDDVLTRLTGELRLDDAQRARIRPIVEETVRRMGRLPPRSPERLAVYEDCMAKLRPLLRRDQQPSVDRMLERARRVFAQP